MTSLKDLIEKYSDEIIKFHKEGKNKADITRRLIEDYSLDIPGDKVDSFRRGISSYISRQEEKDLQTELSIPLSEEETQLADKTTNLLTEPVSPVVAQVFNLELPAEAAADQTEEGSTDDEFNEEELRAKLKDAYEYKDRFWFVQETDTYYYQIPGYPRALKMQGTLIRELKNMYSNLGKAGGLTINQICRAVQLPRDIIIYIKTYMGWTHDSDPFTNEEMILGDIDEMVDRTLEDRKFMWFQKYSNKEQKMVAEAANKWWQFKGRMIEPFVEKMVEAMNDFHARPIPKLERVVGDEHALVIGPYDLHYGKYAWEGDTGSVYNRAKAREVLLESAKNIINELRGKNIEKVIIPVGSDFFHVDTIGNTTTRGTPQDCDGSLVQIMVEGNKLMIEFVDLLRQVANVELILAAGNHDYVLSHQLLEHLGAYYRTCSDVTVTKCYHFRQYAMYGTTLLGFTHGDETKMPELPLLMATEAKHIWGDAEHKAFFTGHLHHEMSKDIKGVKIFQMPSLAGTDRWHHKKGYVGSVKGLAAYLVHKTKGVRVTVMENI